MARHSVVFFSMFVWTVLLTHGEGFIWFLPLLLPSEQDFLLLWTSLSPWSCKSLQVFFCIPWKNRFDQENERSSKAALVLGTSERLVHAGEWKNKEGAVTEPPLRISGRVSKSCGWHSRAPSHTPPCTPTCCRFPPSSPGSGWAGKCSQPELAPLRSRAFWV